MKLAEILDNLKAPIPKRLIRSKKTWEEGKASSSVDYVAWFDLCDLLDDLCDYWEWEIKEIKQITGQPPEEWEINEAIAKAEESGKKAKLPKQKDYLALTGILTIHGEDKSLTRMATGIEEINCSSYGDPSSNAEAMALRRCCAKFGLGRDLWRRENKQRSNNKPLVIEEKPKPLQIGAKPLQIAEPVRLPQGTISKEEFERRRAEKKAMANAQTSP
jgi:hypothetical protein